MLRPCRLAVAAIASLVVMQIKQGKPCVTKLVEPRPIGIIFHDAFCVMVERVHWIESVKYS
jgi:hypothetical protein